MDASALLHSGKRVCRDASYKGKYQIICNLSMGGTNPFAIEKMNLKNVRHCDTLHAKVFIGSESVVIASANVSSNGLGLEGIEQAKWIEAGVEVAATPEILNWFDNLWRASRVVSDSSLEQARSQWKRRQRAKPGLSNGFAEFDTEADDLPLLYWSGGAILGN